MYRPAHLLPDGLIGRAELSAATSESTVKRWLRSGAVVQVQPGVLALADRAADWTVRARAATAWAGGPLSHLSALHAVGLVPEPEGPIHVTVPVARFPRGGAGTIVHCSDRRLVTVQRGPLEAVAPERSIVDAWAWAHSPRRNARADRERPLVRRALIDAVRSREVGVRAVRSASFRAGIHPGRAELTSLLDLVAGGCQSELEIWGVLHVLPGPPTLPAYVQQHRIVLPDGRRIQVDAA